MHKVTIVLLIIVGIIALVLTVSSIAYYRFVQTVRAEVDRLFSNVENNNDTYEQADLEGLPFNVKQWLINSQVVGKEKIVAARLKQTATMRLKEGQQWMPVEAEQYFAVNEPGFIWRAKIKAAPFVHIAGRDKYEQGKGNMLIKLLSLITVANDSGREMDQGTLLRYLAETIWFPGAALNDYITWEEIDTSSARATMSYGAVTASGVFTFSEAGEVTRFEAERYGNFDGGYRLETWSISLSDYVEFDTIKVPSKGTVTWKLSSGDFDWYKFEVTDLEYNKPAAY